MTRDDAIEILIAVAVCDRPILSCDFCARYVGTGNGCDEPTDKEIEEAVLLLNGASKDLAISALRQQEHFREGTKKVEPLTNAQKIRAMSDEELAWELMLWRCEAVARHHGISSEYPDTQKTILEWLQQPAEEDDHARPEIS